MTWHAYPVLTPISADHSFILHLPSPSPSIFSDSSSNSASSSPSLRLPIAGVYYVNAMESVVSTMETQMIAAKNVVRLMGGKGGGGGRGGWRGMQDVV